MNLAVFAFCLNFQKRADRPVGLLNPRKRTSSPNTLKVCFWPIADLTTKSRVSRQLRYYKRIWRPEDLARMGKDRFAGCFVHKPLPSIKPTMSRLTRNKPRRKRGRLRRAVAAAPTEVRSSKWEGLGGLQMRLGVKLIYTLACRGSCG